MRCLPKALAPCFALAFLVPAVTCLPHEDPKSCNGCSNPIATIDSGVVTGKVTHIPGSGSSVNQFLGIPFAQPPTGDLRFAPPEKPHVWDGTYNAVAQPPACIQDFGNRTTGSDFRQALFNTPPPPGESEDCLYLNVYAPSSGGKDRPVLFWIYGGAYRFGASSLPLYDGTSFAANQDIIVVTANYRTNLFGFPRSPQLPLDAQNLGQLDQRLALDWVQRNIRSFGGDPGKVTIAGESAGAVSVSALINTMPVNPPFRGGILQAGQSLIQFPPPPPNYDQTSWEALIQLLNCTDTSDAGILACARAASAETLKEILQATGLSFQSPVADNVTTLDSPAAAYAAGNVSKVPILAGSNFNEGSSFAYGAGENVTEFLAGVSLPTAIVEMIAELYAPGSPATVGLMTGNQIIAQIITDSSARCPAGFLANLTLNALDVPAWQYLFNATFPNTQHPEYPGLGVYHSSEISLVFGTYPTEDSTPVQARLSRWMQKQWADFVKDPQNGPGWAPYPAVGVLGASEDEAVTTRNVRDLDPICAEWDKLYALGLESGS